MTLTLAALYLAPSGQTWAQAQAQAQGQAQSQGQAPPQGQQSTVSNAADTKNQEALRRSNLSHRRRAKEAAQNDAEKQLLTAGNQDPVADTTTRTPNRALGMHRNTREERKAEELKAASPPPSPGVGP